MSIEPIPIEEEESGESFVPLPTLFVREFRALHAYLHKINPDVVPTDLTPRELFNTVQGTADLLLPDVMRTLRDGLDGAKPQDLLDPETWKGLLFLLQMQLEERAEPLREQLARLPGGHFLAGLASSFEGAKPRDFVDPATWKGLFFIVNQQVQAQLEELGERLSAIDETEDDGAQAAS